MFGFLKERTDSISDFRTSYLITQKIRKKSNFLGKMNSWLMMFGTNIFINKVHYLFSGSNFSPTKKILKGKLFLSSKIIAFSSLRIILFCQQPCDVQRIDFQMFTEVKKKSKLFLNSETRCFWNFYRILDSNQYACISISLKLIWKV